jgi:UDP-2,3-diacylglucosamine hydrolase
MQPLGTTFFVSDLHLSTARPAMVDAFHTLVRGPVRRAAALYILGDLFDSWLGDDQLTEPLAKGVASALAELPGLGIPVYLLVGNRDFLFGDRFIEACRATRLPDVVVHEIQGVRTLLMHGDLLCTDDVNYQRLRKHWQDPRRRNRFLARPYWVRRAIAAVLRFGSKHLTAAKREAIMDVNEGAVEAAMREHHVTRMIHGHTHRPACHVVNIDGVRGERWVLADWYRAASFLEVDTRGVHPRVLEMAEATARHR